MESILLTLVVILILTLLVIFPRFEFLLNSALDYKCAGFFFINREITTQRTFTFAYITSQ